MNEPLAIDTEITTSNMGNPFDSNNHLVCYSWCSGGKEDAVQDTREGRDIIQRLVDESSFLVLFNAKFDLHWLRKCGIDFEHKFIWDVQLGEFFLSDQTERFPSLENTAIKYGLGNKVDVIKEQYWSKGINTDQIPWEVLKPYAVQDAKLTYGAFLKQVDQLQGNRLSLFKLQCRDLKVLQEMEWNGLLYDEDKVDVKTKELEQEQEKLQKVISAIYPNIPINFGSPDQLSAFLYGGSISVIERVHDGFFKTGKRAGEPKFKKVEIVHQLPRMFEPLKGTELKKPGLFGTSEDILKKLKGPNHKILSKLMELSKLEKLLGTYYKGLPKLNHLMHWPKGYLYGQYNQCVARTGRCSSSKPNLQNLSGDVLDVFISRYSHGN